MPLKNLSYSDLQHPGPKSIKPISFANDPCLALVKGLPGPAHALADCRFLFALCIAFPDLLDSPARYLHIQCNLLCSQPFLLLANNPMNLALVQFHNSCYGFRGKACAKYFRDYTIDRGVRKAFISLLPFLGSWGQFEDCFCSSGSAGSMPISRGLLCPEFEPFPERGRRFWQKDDQHHKNQ